MSNPFSNSAMVERYIDAEPRKARWDIEAICTAEQVAELEAFWAPPVAPEVKLREIESITERMNALGMPTSESLDVQKAEAETAIAEAALVIKEK